MTSDSAEPHDLLVEGGTVIAYQDGGHAVIEGGYVAVRGDRISAVGRRFEGRARRRIDAAGAIVIPGQISTHAHVGAHEGPRLLVDAGRREFLRSGFLHFLPSRRSGAPGFYAPQDGLASLRYGFATLIRHGVTTVLAYGPGGPDGGETMLRVAADFGIRLVWSPIATGGRYWLEDDGRVALEMDEKRGFEMLETAARFVEEQRGLAGGLWSGAIVLDEYYVSTPALRREGKRLARALGVPFTMHFVEQHREFFETMSRTGRTPVQLLADEDVLDPDTILAHAIYLAGHSLTGFPVVDDVALLGAAGVTVAHSPVAFSRRGVAMESFDRYRKAGVRVALGTDTYPLDMFSEMRTASIMNKLVDRTYEAAPAADVFAASNLGGAAALGRDDLGRIAPGAKADLVVVDTGHLAFGVNPDPIRALVHLATPDMIEAVVVDGRVLVEDGRLTVADEEALLAAVSASSGKVWGSHAAYDPAGRPVEAAFPPSLPAWSGD
ncbi:amidohydrolase family protein [Prosthecomicrobium sp. N25]|uniref:amidohydrolase family protein n=1 Tax=Prosthecomicrobium sp. N25 TaxID=3129254 RepID=UPI0030780B74